MYKMDAFKDGETHIIPEMISGTEDAKTFSCLPEKIK